MLQRFPLPARLVTALEGESLVNDASRLLLYQMAIAAALAGQFTASRAAIVFSMLTVIGVAVGAVYGFGMTWLIKRLGEPMLTVVMAWASYAIAEKLHGSGVLAVVTCGLVLGIRQHQAFDAPTRIKAATAWEAIVFVLDALGLALHGILTRRTRFSLPASASRSRPLQRRSSRASCG